MAGISSVGGVGAGLSQAQFQMEYQVRVLKEQQRMAESLGSVALDLIRTVTAVAGNGTEGRDLDVTA